jgi:DNA-binding NarL/FixJ family response regulator
MSCIRVLCVDDHPVVREGIAAMIDRQTDMKVVASASTGEEALDAFRRHHPDITLMDLRLPGRMSGLEAICAIRRESPLARIMVLTMYQGDEDIYSALQTGASTYLLKDSLSDDLIRMIREVHRGGRPIPSRVAIALNERSLQPPLTSREIDVLELIAKGMRNKQIAAALNIAEETVKVHVKRLLAKLHVNERTGAVNIAVRRGIIHID